MPEMADSTSPCNESSPVSPAAETLETVKASVNINEASVVTVQIPHAEVASKLIDTMNVDSVSTDASSEGIFAIHQPFLQDPSLVRSRPPIFRPSEPASGEAVHVDASTPPSNPSTGRLRMTSVETAPGTVSSKDHECVTQQHHDEKEPTLQCDSSSDNQANSFIFSKRHSYTSVDSGFRSASPSSGDDFEAKEDTDADSSADGSADTVETLSSAVETPSEDSADEPANGGVGPTVLIAGNEATEEHATALQRERNRNELHYFLNQGDARASSSDEEDTVVPAADFNQDDDIPAAVRVGAPTVTVANASIAHASTRSPVEGQMADHGAAAVQVPPVMYVTGLRGSLHANTPTPAGPHTGWPQQQERNFNRGFQHRQQGRSRCPSNTLRHFQDPRNNSNTGFTVDRLRADVTRLQAALAKEQAERTNQRACIEAEVGQYTFKATQDLIHQVFREKVEMTKAQHQLNRQRIEMQRREALNKQLEEYLSAGQKALATRVLELTSQTTDDSGARTISWSQAELDLMRGKIMANAKAEYDLANERLHARFVESRTKQAELELMQENWKVSAKNSVRKEALAEYENGTAERLRNAYEQGLARGMEDRHKKEVAEARERGYQEARRDVEALRKYERRLAGEEEEEDDDGTGEAGGKGTADQEKKSKEVKQGEDFQQSLIDIEDLLG